MMRKPITLVGAACTSAFVGLFVLDRVFLNRATCATSCITNGYPSYQYLQRNEAEKKVQHSTIRGFEVNYLPSNSPIEDRFVAGISSNLGAALFSIIDGHKGYTCSDHLQKHLLKYVTSRLHKEAVSTKTDDLQILMNMSWNSTASLDQSVSDIETSQTASILLSDSVLEQCLQEAFLSAENDISNEGLQDIKLVLQGHSFTPEMKARVMRAIEGACAILAVVLEKSIAVASTGDCRVVVGQKLPDSTWKAIPLSTDQNAQHAGEVERLKKAHPGEESTVIINNRVLGSLMPFRTFGDVDFKWEKKYLAGVSVPVWANYFTPPYITAEPVVTHHKLQNEDKFMILASDGLWDRISNEEAVNVVAETISESKSSIFSSLFRKKSEDQCCRENAATKLLWHSLGGTEESVTKLLNVPRAWSRMFRDDITVMVVFFSDENK